MAELTFVRVCGFCQWKSPRMQTTWASLGSHRSSSHRRGTIANPRDALQCPRNMHSVWASGKVTFNQSNDSKELILRYMFVSFLCLSEYILILFIKSVGADLRATHHHCRCEFGIEQKVIHVRNWL